MSTVPTWTRGASPDSAHPPPGDWDPEPKRLLHVGAQLSVDGPPQDPTGLKAQVGQAQILHSALRRFCQLLLIAGLAKWCQG